MDNIEVDKLDIVIFNFSEKLKCVAINQPHLGTITFGYRAMAEILRISPTVCSKILIENGGEIYRERKTIIVFDDLQKVEKAREEIESIVLALKLIN